MSGALVPSKDELQRRVSSGELLPLSDDLRAAILADNAARAGNQRHKALLESLRHPQVRFVTTGQQLGVYGGPLLTLYKALHAIALARELSLPDGPPVVPLFWLQAEDHDIEEISSVTIPATLGAGEVGEDAELLKRVGYSLHEWVGDERRRSVGSLALPLEARTLTAALLEQLPKLEGQCWLAPALAQAYQPGTTVLEAFRLLFDALLGEEAVLYLNPQLPAVRRGAVAIHRLALKNYLEIADKLTSTGEGAQVHVRARSPLFFFHPEGAAGPRYRLEADATGVFHAIGTTGVYSAEELQRAIDAEDGSISASALLRPVIQDSILPSLCYIGGQAELRYFEQVALVAPFVGAPAPKILPRVRFLLVDPKAARLQRQLGVAMSELLQPLQTLQESRIERQLGEPTSTIFSRMREQLDAALFAPAAVFARIDGEAEQLLRRTQDKIARAVDGLEERIARSSAAAFSRDEGRIRRLHALLRPDDQPQERILAGAWFAAQYGPTFATALIKRIDPFALEDREVIVELSEL